MAGHLRAVQKTEKLHSAHAAPQATHESKRYLNVVAYDHAGEMPSDYRRSITPEYAQGLIGSPYMWNHADGALPLLASRYHTTDQLQAKLEERSDRIGTVIGTLYNGRKLYATVELRDGVVIPPKLASWLENSISDICWRPRVDGKKEPVELSATPEGLRGGCIVVGQEDHPSFCRRIVMNDFEKLTPEQRAAWDTVVKSFSNNPDVERLASLIDPSLLSTFGSDFHSNMVAAIAASKAMNSAAQPTAASAAAAPSTAQPVVASASASAQPFRAIAEKMLHDQLTSQGVPREISDAFIAGGGVEQWQLLEPVIASASVSAYERGKLESGGGMVSDMPERPPKRARVEPAAASTHPVLENNLKLVENNKALKTYLRGVY